MGPEPDTIDWGALTPSEARVVYVDIDDTLARSFGSKRLSECFVAYLPKPQLLLDDQHPSEWRTLRWAHPNGC